MAWRQGTGDRGRFLVLVAHIYDENGALVASYTYDAWGNHTVTNYTSDNIGNINPFRYRSYYYDSDTQLYYLNSRYYDAKLHRFINADDISYLGANGDLQGFNLYAYCSNNPTKYIDPAGQSIRDFCKNFIKNIWRSVEAEIGIGLGFGYNVLKRKVGIDASRDNTVFLDDGKLLLGNTVSFQAAIAENGVGGTHTQYTDGDHEDVHYHSYTETIFENAQSIIDCERCSHCLNASNKKGWGLNGGDVVVSTGMAVHFVIGGHFSVGFNFSELGRRMWEDLIK